MRPVPIHMVKPIMFRMDERCTASTCFRSFAEIERDAAFLVGDQPGVELFPALRCESFDEDGLTVNESPDDSAQEVCRELGRSLAKW